MSSHHGFAAIAEARGFDGADVERAAQLVHDERGERFAFDIFGDDQERLADLGDLLEQREQVLQAADLLFVNQDVSVFELGFHRLGVGHEVGREIALVELHAFDDFERGLDRLGFFDRDGAVFADFVHGVGDDFADGGVPVGGNGGDLLDFFLVLDLLGDLGELFDGGFNGLVDAALDADRVRARGDVLQAFAVDRFGENGGGGGAVAGGVAGLAGDFAHHLGAHVFIGIFQFDFLGDGHAVLGDGGEPNFLSRTTLRPLGPSVALTAFASFCDALEQGLTSGFVKDQLFCCHSNNYYLMCYSCEGLFDDARMSSELQDLVFLAVEFDFRAAVFADEDAVALLDFEWEPSCRCRRFCRCRARRRSLSMGFSLAVSGMMMPPFLTSFSSSGSTRTRSPRGLRFTLP